MSLYTSNYLKNLAQRRRVFINEQQRKFTYKGVDKNQYFDIFLSHSAQDKEEIEGIYAELSNQGFKVYVDWIVDAHLDRAEVTKESAELIRTRLKNSYSLLLAFSSNAQMSKWMPWELGHVDGDKARCAIFPVSKSDNDQKTFHRSEYLLLYPYIKRAAITGYQEKTYVTESAYSYVEFDRWVKGYARPEYNNQNINIL